jgi:hypothetical protein
MDAIPQIFANARSTSGSDVAPNAPEASNQVLTSTCQSSTVSFTDPAQLTIPTTFVITI